MTVTDEFLLNQLCSVEGSPKAFEELKRRHLMGNQWASVYYANWLMSSRFGTPDKDTAMAILNDLVARGFGHGYYMMSICDKQSENYWLQKAVDARDADAIASLAYKFYLGKDVEKDKARAYELWQLSYELGSEHGAENLIEYYVEKGYKTKAVEIMKFCLDCHGYDALSRAYHIGYNWGEPEFRQLYQKYKPQYPRSFWED